MRPGDNLFSSSRLAIDPDDGSIKWHFQTTPHDGWDFDGRITSYNVCYTKLLRFGCCEAGLEIAALPADRLLSIGRIVRDIAARPDRRRLRSQRFLRLELVQDPGGVHGLARGVEAVLRRAVYLVQGEARKHDRP